MAKSINERKSKYFEGQKALGRITRGVSATIHEHDKIKHLLSEMRGENNVLDWIEQGESEHLTAEGHQGEWVILVGNTISLNLPQRQTYMQFDTVEEAKTYAELVDAKP